MKKISRKKLRLHRETLNQMTLLGERDLRGAAGGTIQTFPCTTTCSDSFCDSICP